MKQIEGLPVDRRSRPLQDAKVVNCGELVPKSKLKGTSTYVLVLCSYNPDKAVAMYLTIFLCFKQKKQRNEKRALARAVAAARPKRRVPKKKAR